MGIQFEGFQNTIPLIWVFFLIAGLLFLTFWTYWRVEGLTAGWRWLLTGLRTVAFLLLCLLLLNPVFSLNEQNDVPVKIGLLLDNSQSTTVESGGYGGSDYYRTMIGSILREASERFNYLEIDAYGFDSGLFPAESPDNLPLDGSRTNIDGALSDFLDNLDRHEAAVLVTDGIVTSGRNPSAIASRVPFPVYTVGIGDTARQRDIIVQGVDHNPTASLNTRTNIQASILNNGFPDQDITVQLRREGATIDETVIRSSQFRSVKQVSFDLYLEEEGLQQYQVHVPEIDGEWSAKNNTRYFSINVRDDRLRILHLAFEIHPDVKTVRNFLREDKLVSLESRTWIHHDRYVEGDLPDRPDTLDLIILHGFPHRDMDDEHAGQIADRYSGNALFFIASAGQDVTRLSTLFAGQLPIRFQSGFSWYDVQMEISEPQRNHAILDFGYPEDLRLPSTRGGIRNSASGSNASTLLHSAFRGTLTDAPMLAVQTIGDRNISYLNTYNFFQWSLSPRDGIRLFWENLLNNIVKWTASQPGDELLVLTPSDPVYQIGEPVILNAFLRNEAGEQEENATIEITLSSDNFDERRYVMRNEGNGRYAMEISNLPEGNFTFSGSALRGNREIDTRTGEFIIGGVNREFLDTIRDDDLLQFIASTTGGTYLIHSEISELLDIMKEQIGFDQRKETISRTLALHRHPVWFIIVILLMTLEWSLRKYRALA